MAVISTKPKKEERTKRLKDVSNEDVFRFPHDRYDTCVELGLFWWKLNDPNKNKEGRILAAALEGSEVRLFDDDRRVVVHRCDILVYPNK